MPGHVLAVAIGFGLVLLGIGALLSGEREPYNLLLGMGIGTGFGSGVVAFAVRRADRRPAG